MSVLSGSVRRIFGSNEPVDRKQEVAHHRRVQAAHGLERCLGVAADDGSLRLDAVREERRMTGTSRRGSSSTILRSSTPPRWHVARVEGRSHDDMPATGARERAVERACVFLSSPWNSRVLKKLQIDTVPHPQSKITP